MTIKFSTPMKVEGLNLTQINGFICDIYLQAEDNWFEINENFNMSRLNFTWNVTSYIKDIMIITLKFNNPLSISPMIQKDKIVFHILDMQFFFISETLLEDLGQDYRTLRYPVKRQMIPSEASAQFLSSTELASKVLLNS